ncbi:TetR/AcrR family transcriptional regulator [uncultured Roseobacter sp.]|uniref:TetR/AcrR family transcriptional regulator n=1 Tax=uncultured Roseobacter sp. TaxID=114847 RepID=UPI00262F5DEF|nr:TetR/AcrR family transcriptional regulator [uncultured Roseobacter sp.]
MDTSERAARIEAAAYKILAEKGFKGASMLAIAKAAKASNETLYNWYGDKTGLFAAMIRQNTSVVVDELQTARATGRTGRTALREVGRALLTMVTSDKAVALNRAAAGDISGKLGKILAEEGRGRVLPIIAQLLEEAFGTEHDMGELTDCYISLLIGDLQIRRATGAQAAPDRDFVVARADRALDHVQKIYASLNQPP